MRRAIAAGDVAVSRLSEVEVTSAMARRAKEGRMSKDDAVRFSRLVATDFNALRIIEISTDVVAIARALLLAHPLRASDAVQLASGVFLWRSLGVPIEFVCFDEVLNAAARAEGLTTSRLGA